MSTIFRNVKLEKYKRNLGPKLDVKKSARILADKI